LQAQLAGRNLIMVLLDSAGRYSRIGDAERLRRWLSLGGSHAGSPPVPVQPRSPSAEEICAAVACWSR
jgi:D-alanyl-D-alanine endopeptidase (penicillin-binding protein 7)